MNFSVAIMGTRGYPSYYGGFETAIRHLAPYLVSRGWDVTVYGRPGATRPDDPTRDPAVNAVETRGIESRSLSTLSFGFSAARDARRRRPDVALVMNVANGYWLPMLRSRSIPTLVNVDGMEWERAKWGRIARTIFKLGAKATARYADAIACDALEIGRRWREDFGRDSVFIPYGGIVPPEGLPVEPGLEPRKYVLYVARFVPENSFEEFLAAARLLATDTDVVIVGSSGYGGEFDEAAAALDAELPRVHWLGHVSDDDRLAALWAHAGVYFHGHSVGGTNPALVQAMAAGSPVVARDTVYNREVLGPDAVLTQPTAQGIDRVIRSVLSSPDQQATMSSNARARAVEHYSWDAVCEAYEKSLRQLVRAR